MLNMCLRSWRRLDLWQACYRAAGTWQYTHCCLIERQPLLARCNENFSRLYYDACAREWKGKMMPYSSHSAFWRSTAACRHVRGWKEQQTTDQRQSATLHYLRDTQHSGNICTGAGALTILPLLAASRILVIVQLGLVCVGYGCPHRRHGRCHSF